MTAADLEALMRAIAPTIRNTIAAEIDPVRKRLKKAEHRIAVLEGTGKKAGGKRRERTS